MISFHGGAFKLCMCYHYFKSLTLLYLTRLVIVYAIINCIRCYSNEILFSREKDEIKKKDVDERSNLDESTEYKDCEKTHKLEEQKRQIQEALNQQTYAQFKAYVEQHFPGDPIQVLTSLLVVVCFET